MRAYLLPAPDEAARLGEAPVPEPGPGEIRIRVTATSVNPVDDLIRHGRFRGSQEHRFPAILGRDVAGLVDALGPGVSTWTEGAQVFGFVKREYVGDGTFADYVVVPEGSFVAPVPAGVPLPRAAALGLAGVTALECVDAVPSGPGDVVLVNGAAGAVGTFAVQLAKARGATVLATARSDEGLRLLGELGVEHVLDLRDSDLVDACLVPAPGGVDGLIDLARHGEPPLGRDDVTPAHREFARLCAALLTDDGRASSTTNGGRPELLNPGRFSNIHSTPTRASLERIAEAVGRGDVRPVISHEFGFDDIEAAFDRLMTPGTTGNVMVTLE